MTESALPPCVGAKPEDMSVLYTSAACGRFFLPLERKQTMWTAKRVTSIITGALGALGVAYLGLSQIWALPYGPEIQETTGIIVSCLSAILAVATGTSVASDHKAKHAAAGEE